MPHICHIRKGHEKPLARRHPWVFSGAVQRIEAEGEKPKPGDVVLCRAGDGRFLAWGTLNPKGRIAVRAFSFDEKVPLDRKLIRSRIAGSIRRRLPLLPQATNAYRLVHSEADGLPGLVVDRFAGTIVCQITTAGMLNFLEDIKEALASELSPRCILLKTPRRQAKEEFLPQASRAILGETPEQSVEFVERGVKYLADLTSGQKTGFYLDQRDHRYLVRKLAEGKTVLDAYSYSGGFGLHASLGGAKHVTCVDSSAGALELAEKNFNANDIPKEKRELVKADVPGFLRAEKKSYDLIVLDPPPLSPGKSKLKSASRAYKDINLHALKLLTPGGLLVTFSCSGSVNDDLLRKIVFGAALDAKREVRILQSLSQPFDHPVSVYHPEGEYLHGLLLQAE